jgi:hypothetical protein
MVRTKVVSAKHIGKRPFGYKFRSLLLVAIARTRSILKEPLIMHDKLDVVYVDNESEEEIMEKGVVSVEIPSIAPPIYIDISDEEIEAASTLQKMKSTTSSPVVPNKQTNTTTHPMVSMPVSLTFSLITK